MNKNISNNPSLYATDGHNSRDANFIAPQAADDEIDLRELFSAIWAGKWIIISITAIFAIGAVIFALKQPNVYKSEALLAPATESQQGGGLAALAGQFGGLASMAGINLGGGGSDKTQLAIEVLKSRQFISQFIKKHGILVEVMAAEKWDMANNKLILDPKLYDEKQQKWVREVKSPFKAEPSMQEAYKAFSKLLTVSTAKDTGLVTIAIQYYSPAIAQQWVTWLVEDINAEMKLRDVTEANKSSDFLTQKISETNIADIRSILYKLVEEQAKTIMFAEVRDEYVFKTIDPALIPEEKAGPKRALICVLGTMLGGMLGVMLVLIRYFIKKDE